jgi:hypothetical protein
MIIGEAIRWGLGVSNVETLVSPVYPISQGPGDEGGTFAYRILISNEGDVPVTLTAKSSNSSITADAGWHNCDLPNDSVNSSGGNLPATITVAPGAEQTLSFNIATAGDLYFGFSATATIGTKVTAYDGTVPQRCLGSIKFLGMGNRDPVAAPIPPSIN